MGNKRKRKKERTEKESPTQGAVHLDEAAPQKEASLLEMSKTSIPRRDFWTRAGQITAALSFFTATTGAARFLMPDFTDGPPSFFPIGTLSNFKINTVTWIRYRSLFIIRNEIGIGALSSECTHLGCTVRKTASGFECPCHGAVFDPQGEVVFGPARAPLPWYEVALLSDGQLWIDRTKQRYPPGIRPLGVSARETE